MRGIKETVLLSWKYAYKYDEHGNEIERAWYNEDGTLKKKESYKYDESGNRIEVAEYEIKFGDEAVMTKLKRWEYTY